MKQTKAKPKKTKKMRKGRNTQSLPKIHGSPERPREDEDDTNNSPQLLGEIDSVSSNGKETSIERKLHKPKPKKLKPIKRKTKKVNNLIPISITSADVHVEPERKVLYCKIHKYGKKEYLIEISRTKVKYYIISIRMNKNQKTQVQEFFFKQGKKLIKSAGGIEALADRIKFKYGSLTIEDQNKLLYEGKESVKSMRQLAQKRFHSPIGDTIKSPQSELSQHLDKEHNDEDSDTEEHHDEDQHQEEVPMQAEAGNGQYNDESDTPKADELDNLKKKIEEEPESVHEYPKDEED